MSHELRNLEDLLAKVPAIAAAAVQDRALPADQPQVRAFMAAGAARGMTRGFAGWAHRRSVLHVGLEPAGPGCKAPSRRA